MENTILEIKRGLGSLDISGGKNYPQAVTNYFKHYHLDFAGEDIEHLFGTFDSNGYTLAAHIYKPAEYKATVIGLHGYLNHCGQLSRLLEFLLSQGYAVALYDAPGHGLSSGEKAAIDDFSTYSSVLTDFAGTVKGQLHGPYHCIGFSTGSSAVIDLLLAGNTKVFDKVILAAPLVRSWAWKQSKVAFKYYSSFTDSIRRWPRKNSSDKKFLQFNRNKDYLQTSQVPLKWVSALYDWNDKIKNSPKCSKAIKVIQGNNDKTIDAHFNIAFLRKKFPNAEVTIIKNARHELFNESVDIRKEVFSQISNYLEVK